MAESNSSKARSYCELCRTRQGSRCCSRHDIVICSRCYAMVTGRILWPTIEAIREDERAAMHREPLGSHFG